ncbi:MAG: elongation factor P [Candidatus Omnitrophica bacterium]|nr:elongation factor P [Candidatus Omnitrophota bacterium]
MINANELKRKDHILIDAQPYAVLEVTFASPSARGASTMVKARVRNLLNSAVLDKTFKTSEKFDEPDVELSPATFQYSDPAEYHFMDDSTYEQFSLGLEKLGDARFYLKEGMTLQALKFNGQVVSLELPPYVELKIVQTDPPIKGASAAGSSKKPAVLETGLKVQVPLYIEEGTVVRVNTETGEAGGRA